MSASWRIERLSKAHSRRYFACGEGSLDEYLRRFAHPHQASDIAKTYVALEPENPRRVVIGYYSIAVGAIRPENVPAHAAKRSPILVAWVGSLAVDEAFQREGLGQHLLMDALRRVRRAAAKSAIAAVVLDAKHEKGARFYACYEFERLPNRAFTLWLPMAAVEKLFRTA